MAKKSNVKTEPEVLTVAQIKEQLKDKNTELEILRKKTDIFRTALLEEEKVCNQKRIELNQLQTLLDQERNNVFVSCLSQELVDVLAPNHSFAGCSDTSLSYDNDCARCVLVQGLTQKWIGSTKWKFVMEDC